MANGGELREMLAKTRNQKFRKVSETMIDGWVQSAIASKRRWETDEFKNKFNKAHLAGSIDIDLFRSVWKEQFYHKERFFGWGKITDKKYKKYTGWALQIQSKWKEWGLATQEEYDLLDTYWKNNVATQYKFSIENRQYIFYTKNDAIQFMIDMGLKNANSSFSMYCKKKMHTWASGKLKNYKFEVIENEQTI